MIGEDEILLIAILTSLFLGYTIGKIR